MIKSDRKTAKEELTLSRALTLAFANTNLYNTSAFPLSAAICNGVELF